MARANKTSVPSFMHRVTHKSREKKPKGSWVEFLGLGVLLRWFGNSWSFWGRYSLYKHRGRTLGIKMEHKDNLVHKCYESNMFEPLQYQTWILTPSTSSSTSQFLAMAVFSAWWWVVTTGSNLRTMYTATCKIFCNRHQGAREYSFFHVPINLPQ